MRALLASIKKAWLFAAIFVVAIPIALGPATPRVVALLGGGPEHACMCGMKRGTCGCPECERIERDRRATSRARVTCVRRTCEREDGTIAAPELPACAPAGAGIAIAPAPRHVDFVAPARRLASELAREPSTPPPRA